VATRQQVEQEFNGQKLQGMSELEKKVNAKLCELAQKPWKDLGKEALKLALTKGAGQVPVVGGGIAWVLEQALTDEPPGQPIANALTQLAVVREFHAAVLKMLKPGGGVAWNWKTAVRHLAILELAVEEARKQLTKTQQAIDRIEHILSTHYHATAVNNLLEKIVEKERPEIELTSFPSRAPLKPLSHKGQGFQGIRVGVP
jgi:hypothetical protein